MVSVRTSIDLKTKLQTALENSGRTLTQEVEMRLERSFSADEFAGGQRNAAFLDVLGASIKEIEIKTGTSWLSDDAAWSEVKLLTTKLLEERRPTPAKKRTLLTFPQEPNGD